MTFDVVYVLARGYGSVSVHCCWWRLFVLEGDRRGELKKLSQSILMGWPLSCAPGGSCCCCSINTTHTGGGGGKKEEEEKCGWKGGEWKNTDETSKIEENRFVSKSLKCAHTQTGGGGRKKEFQYQSWTLNQAMLLQQQQLNTSCFLFLCLTTGGRAVYYIKVNFSLFHSSSLRRRRRRRVLALGRRGGMAESRSFNSFVSLLPTSSPRPEKLVICCCCNQSCVPVPGSHRGKGN